MGRKRRSGLSEGASPGAGPAAALSLAECLCPVCQELLAEPVTPPCGHSLCLGCFQQTVAISNLNCPLCRRRLSNWARGKARDGTLVNAELQERIQQQYPRLQAEENNHREVDRLCSRPQLCKPGEVRKEYEEQISKLRAERHARDEEEQRASEDLIQKILAEEKERLIYEEKQRKEVGEQLKRDEELAQMLSKEVNSTHKTHPESVTILSRRTSLKSNSSSVTKGNRLIPHSPSSTGNIQKYLSPTYQKIQKAESTRSRNDPSAVESESTDADDIISNSDSISSISLPHYEEEQEPVCSSALPPFAQCIGRASMADIRDYQQEDENAGKHSPGGDESEMVGVCSGEQKGKESYKEDVLLAELKINSINSHGEGDQLDFATLSNLGSKRDHARTSANCFDVDSPNYETVCYDDDLELKQKSCLNQGSKYQVGNQAPIKFQAFVKRKTWNSSEVEGETCSTVKKRKVCPNEACESIELSQGISHEELLLDWEKSQAEKLRMEEQDRLLAIRIQRKLDKEMLVVNRKRGSPDEYLLRANKSSINCEKRIRGKEQTSRKLQTLQSGYSAVGNKKRECSDSFAISNRKNKSWTVRKVKNQRPLRCMDANSAALIPVKELSNSRKQQTIVEMFQKHATN
ncbi:E3 ubiquitin-protein ligase rnf168 [Chiloscyllium plagiosum]|uniref:E3 ubiquitin-protein ligase rnf168 n=1 Tax=Chiloscyllium plagiosum TaxID=36176 RepID=UPI001CB84AEE|nr:E3 ubiquitin-protein ligase rnf168 [Chiloscyllium plagiosum]